MERIMVTGAAGFVGSHTAEFYAKIGCEVIGVDNLGRGAMLGYPNRAADVNWRHLEKVPNMTMLRIDIRDGEALSAACRGVELIVHAAGQVGVFSSIRDPRVDFEVNSVGTLNVLEAARKVDASVVFCSTNKVYGMNVNKIPISEEAARYRFADGRFEGGVPEDLPVDHTHHTPYGCSKLAADLYVQEYAHTYGLRTAIFRMSCIYGEGQLGVEEQGWLAWFVIATLTDTPITIYGDGKQVRDALHVEDLVRAFDAFRGRRDSIKGEVFNIGGGPENTLSLLDLLKMLEEFFGKRPRVSYADWRPADQKVYISNVSKAKGLLGWTPSIGTREGVRRLVEWARRNEPLFEGYEGSRRAPS